MKKSTKLFKRFFTLLLVVLMSIESFAAVVGDNDGAAFITKAEFDSMKNDFQSASQMLQPISDLLETIEADLQSHQRDQQYRNSMYQM